MTVPQPPAPAPLLSPRVIVTVALLIGTAGLAVPWSVSVAAVTVPIDWVVAGFALFATAGLVHDLIALLSNPERRRHGWAFAVASAAWAADAAYLILLPLFDTALGIPYPVDWGWSAGQTMRALGWAILAGLAWRAVVWQQKHQDAQAAP